MILVIVFLAIGFIVLSSTIFKLHPLAGLLLAAIGVGISAGLPIDHLAEIIGKGFGDLMAKIGLMVILGCVIGAILDQSGAAIKVADVILKWFGKKHPALAMSLIGAIVGIPVFCDSGFIILHKLNQVVAKRTNINLATIALSLSGGLFATHTFVPPTPGPLSAAGNLGIPNAIGLVILIGLLVSIPSLFLSTWFATRFGKSIQVVQEKEGADKKISENQILPPTWKAFMPILLPIILITLASVAQLFPMPAETLRWISLLGSPLISFIIAILFSYSLFPERSGEKILACFKSGIDHCGTTLVLVGAGGAFGAVLKATTLNELVSNWLMHREVSGVYLLFIAFIIAAFFKTAQGSTTSAMVLTTSILAPLLASLGFVEPLEIVLVVMAVGSGAMFVSHTNDAWFWVVSQFTGISVKDAYRTHTILTGLQGIVSLAMTVFLYLILT